MEFRDTSGKTALALKFSFENRLFFSSHVKKQLMVSFFWKHTHTHTHGATVDNGIKSELIDLFGLERADKIQSIKTHRVHRPAYNRPHESRWECRKGEK